MLYHKIISVKPLPGLKLLADFETGESRLYDVNTAIAKHSDFTALTYITGLFELVRVEVSGAAVVWNDYLDISSEELYFNGTAV
jgi:hypothetical protein